MRQAVLVLVLGVWSGAAQAEWVDMSRGLPERDIHSVAMGPSRSLYASTDKRLYRWDGGTEWAPVRGLRPTGHIHRVLFTGDRLYVASDKGIQVLDGKKWMSLYRGIGPGRSVVLSLGEDARRPESLLAGTPDGLIRVERSTGKGQKLHGVSGAVYSIVQDGKGALWVSSSEGVFVSESGEGDWRKRNTGPASEETEEIESLAQFNIEEMAAPSVPAHLVYMPGKDEVFLATSHGPLRGLTKGETWDALADLPDKDVRGFHYDPSSGDLYIASANGVYRYPKPEFHIAGVGEGPQPVPADILRNFSHEPTIRQVQEAAIRYAEVHPDKIKSWREAAAAKAWMPTLSLSADASDDQNIDLDRGGTNDPDRFIEGPEERSRDWHVGVSWDLSDLVWNDAQTSIDTRSRLLVELRDDVLTEVTHLYFERRRLQVEELLVPAKDLPLRIERLLKIEELTAGIDALTGGYLSKEVAYVQA